MQTRKRPFQDVTNSHDERTFILDPHTIKKPTLNNNVNEPNNEKNRIQVYVRVRPQNDRELNNSSLKRILHLPDEKSLIFDPKEDGLNTYFYQGKMFKEVGKKLNKNLSFKFDRVFNEYATNRDVFNVTTKDLIDPLLEGCNCTVFAYGATGSGKTHTVIGNEREPGVIYSTVMELFKKIDRSSDLEISISYLEIYNENVYDLLAPTTGKSLAVREDSKRGVVVANLSVHYPEDTNHLINMIKIGNNNRAKQATNANAQSSRSHAIFQIYIEKHDYSSPHTMSIRLSKMSLIDLAGSERAAVAYKGKRSQSLQREGSNINKSLLSLGNCINALVMKQKIKTTHIPYRNSKLTLLLRDSLNGSSKTVMIAAISPTSQCYEDTHNTLTYASRAMGIQFNYKPNMMSINARGSNPTIEAILKENERLRNENESLRNENERLKRELIEAHRHRVY